MIVYFPRSTTQVQLTTYSIDKHWIVAAYGCLYAINKTGQDYLGKIILACLD